MIVPQVYQQQFAPDAGDTRTYHKKWKETLYGKERDHDYDDYAADADDDDDDDEDIVFLVLKVDKL